jgi:hypothetical protein
MNRINLFRQQSRTTPTTLNSVAWGTINSAKNVFDTTSPFIFAVVLIACAFTVGCASDQAKNDQKTIQPAGSTPTSVTQPVPAIATNMAAAVSPIQPAAAKPMHKKIVHKAPPTLTYADKTTGVSFQYPRKYALKTGDSATELVSTDPIPMDFTQPGGVALAAIALPESTYPNSNLASAYFNVSMNKSLTAEQCGEFSVPQPVNAPTPTDATVQATAQVTAPPVSKLLIGDMELQSTETKVGGETTNGPREETSKYYHVFQNGACYEFALRVATAEPTTTTENASALKSIDRGEVFHRLEKILATVKFVPIAAEATPEVKAAVQTAPAETPAQ